MSTFVQLNLLQTEALEELDQLQRDADDNYELERSSTVHIQRVFRGSQCRALITHWNCSTTQIQRTFRGHRGRQYVLSLFKARNLTRQNAVYDWCATQIQRVFRAFYSRKYRHDHAVRKAYIRSIEERGNELRQRLQDYVERQLQQQEDEAISNINQRFQHLTESTHYLVSTKAINGIYNPPSIYAETPTVSDIPIEEHIRAGVRDLLRRSGYKKALIRDHNGTLRVPYKGPKYRLSLQASVPYDVIEKDQREQKLRHKYTRLGPDRFAAGGKLKTPRYERGIHEGDEYLETWRNPYNIRGIPRNEASLRNRDTSFAKAPSTPFVASVGGNKSSVLANDVFDVMYEAEISGGVNNRFKGTTIRFGIPDTCDARGIETPAYQPPTPRPLSRTFRKSRYTLRSKSAPTNQTVLSPETSLETLTQVG